MARHTVLKTFKERKAKGEFTGKYGPRQSEKSLQLFHAGEGKGDKQPTGKSHY